MWIMSTLSENLINLVTPLLNNKASNSLMLSRRSCKKTLFWSLILVINSENSFNFAFQFSLFCIYKSCNIDFSAVNNTSFHLMLNCSLHKPIEGFLYKYIYIYIYMCVCVCMYCKLYVVIFRYLSVIYSI